MADIERGDLLFDAQGRLVGVVAEVTDDEILLRRHGLIRVSAKTEGGADIVTKVIGKFVKVS